MRRAGRSPRKESRPPAPAPSRGAASLKVPCRACSARRGPIPWCRCRGAPENACLNGDCLTYYPSTTLDFTGPSGRVGVFHARAAAFARACPRPRHIAVARPVHRRTRGGKRTGAGGPTTGGRCSQAAGSLV
jgi:hypothetical protein